MITAYRVIILLMFTTASLSAQYFDIEYSGRFVASFQSSTKITGDLDMGGTAYNPIITEQSILLSPHSSTEMDTLIIDFALEDIDLADSTICQYTINGGNLSISDFSLGFHSGATILITDITEINVLQIYITLLDVTWDESHRQNLYLSTNMSHTPPGRWIPLQIGNIWQYDVNGSSVGTPYILRYSVIDTVVLGSELAFILLEEQYQDTEWSSNSFDTIWVDEYDDGEAGVLNGVSTFWPAPELSSGGDSWGLPNNRTNIYGCYQSYSYWIPMGEGWGRTIFGVGPYCIGVAGYDGDSFGTSRTLTGGVLNEMGWGEYIPLSIHSAGSPIIPELLINIYPNPSNMDFSIDFFSSESGPAIFELVDMSGRQIFSKHIDLKRGYTKCQLSQLHNVSSLPSGVYLTVVRAGKAINTKKLMVLK